jgi:hypothetical protein
MGLPFETPGGYQDDDTTPDSGRYDDDLALMDHDGYSHDRHDEDTTGEDDPGDDDFDFDFDTDGFGQGDQAGWDDTGPSGQPRQM